MDKSIELSDWLTKWVHLIKKTFRAPVLPILLNRPNLFTTLQLGSKAETVLLTQLCYIQTKMDRLYRKNDHLWSFYYNICAFLGFICKLCFVQNCVLMNNVTKRFVMYMGIRYVCNASSSNFSEKKKDVPLFHRCVESHTVMLDPIALRMAKMPNALGIILVHSASDFKY